MSKLRYTARDADFGGASVELRKKARAKFVRELKLDHDSPREDASDEVHGLFPEAEYQQAYRGSTFVFQRIGKSNWQGISSTGYVVDQTQPRFIDVQFALIRDAQEVMDEI